MFLVQTIQNAIVPKLAPYNQQHSYKSDLVFLCVSAPLRKIALTANYQLPTMLKHYVDIKSAVRPTAATTDHALPAYPCSE